MARLLSRWFLVVGVVVLGLAMVGYFGQADAPGATVVEPERECTDVSAGQSILISFPIHNPTRHTVRVVGFAET